MKMSQFSGSRQAALDYNSTIIGAVELSEKKWVLAVQLPGVGRHSRHVLEACGDGLASFVERVKWRPTMAPPPVSIKRLASFKNNVLLWIGASRPTATPIRRVIP
jgi:hypothetical protein